MNYNKKTVKDVDVKGKKVLLRCDFNVPMAKDGSGVITDDKRIRAALPTIQYLLDQGAAVIACSHLGKPEPSFEKWAKKQAEKGKDPASLTKEKWEKTLEALCMEPVAKRLGELLGRDVVLAGDVVGPDAQAKAAALQPGEIMLLQNTRFEKGETKNDPELAKAMAGLAGADGVYVSDAFGAVHRAHASTAGVAAYLPAVSGFLIEKELEIMGGALADPKRPLVAILGGSKVSSKIGVINHLLDIADTIIIGGGMAYTFSAAQGGKVGDSLLEEDWKDYSLEMIQKAKDKGVELLLHLAEEHEFGGAYGCEVAGVAEENDPFSFEILRETDVSLCGFGFEFGSFLAQAGHVAGRIFHVFRVSDARFKHDAGLAEPEPRVAQEQTLGQAGHPVGAERPSRRSARLTCGR